MGLKVESKGLKEEKLTLFDENTRFVSSYKEAKIITRDDNWFQLSMVLDGVERIYTCISFEEAYAKYEELLEKDENGFFM